MKILMINKFYYIKGGSETYMFSLKRVLEKNGHEVIPFSMKNENNEYSEYENFFIDNIDYSDKNIFHKIKNAIKIIYNFDANRKLKRLISQTKPEIAHLHIFQHQLSPSILKVLKDANIPIIYTVHDLKPVCLNYKMLNKCTICEKCINEQFYKCLTGKCVKNSYLFSFINVMEGYLHKYLKSYDKIDKFITPSNFYREKMIEGKYDSNKILHIPNFIESNKIQVKYEYKDYFVYVGRLSEEKGIKTLIEAMKKVTRSKLKIVGTGPLEMYLKEKVKLEKIENIEFVGFKKGEELNVLISNCKFLVIPSEWYENGPMSVIEAMAFGKPIIGAKIAGIKELVKDNENGFLFKSKNSDELALCINKLLDNENNIIKFGKKSREIIDETYNENYHYEKIINIYRGLIKNNNRYL